MRIAILGVGALGCLFGARLSRHADVTLIGHWPEQIDALRAGLRYVHPNGHEDSIPLCVAHGTDGVAPCDAVLILTKASQIETSAREAAQVLAPDGVAITLQNGLGNRAILAQAVGKDRAAQGVTLQAASLRGPGLMVYGGEGPTHLAERMPGDPAVVTMQGWIAAIKGDWKQALAAYNQAVNNAPHDRLAAVLRIDALRHTGQEKKAAKEQRRLSKQREIDVPAWVYSKSRSAFATGYAWPHYLRDLLSEFKNNQVRL